MDLLSQYKQEHPEAFQEQKPAPRTCGGGAVYPWFDGTNTCGWWGAGLYVIKNF